MDSYLKQLSSTHGFLEKLPLYEFYELIEKTNCKPTAPNTKCDYNIVKNIKDSQEALSLCQKSENILHSFKDTSNKIFQSKNKNKFCHYFKYWLNGKTKYSTIDVNNSQRIYHNLSFYNFALDNDYKCNNISELNVKKETFEKIKYLFFYKENLYWIKELYTKVQNVNKDSFTNFLEECSYNYNDILCTGTCKNNSFFKLLLENLQNEFNSTLLHLKASGHDIKIEPLKSPKEHTCKNIKEGTLCDLVIQNPKWNDENNLDVTDFYEGEDEDGSDGTEGSLSTVIVSITFSILTIMSFLFFIHKFTTFGSRLQHFIQRKKRMWSNLNEQTEEVLNTSEYQGIHSENTYNLAYNSA
ncbi:PIR Superfamily Protein [Plasmodium ovale wallikeri]|uniref:PIR Superfamily Protein n=2 Tax=Plasmodium ovale TaxID=36330 RepID=A0A1A9AJJ2_PLAOA|nr:PIR Superfamily Protein [Plasmodium ovale wallikeri]SBT59037.1 PIR Superfamily Protein [Plasmodium ovale wallikeri]SBT74164.1 PIR protein [Plasmodium ovale]